MCVLFIYLLLHALYLFLHDGMGQLIKSNLAAALESISDN